MDKIKSEQERTFETLWKQLGGVELTSEYRFHSIRKWRFDFAIPDKKIALEIEGGIWTEGRHNRPVGYTNDCEKYNVATMLGWRVFRFTSLMWDDPDKYILPIIQEGQTNFCSRCGGIVPETYDDYIPF